MGWSQPGRKQFPLCGSVGPAVPFWDTYSKTEKTSWSTGGGKYYSTQSFKNLHAFLGACRHCWCLVKGSSPRPEGLCQKTINYRNLFLNKNKKHFPFAAHHCPSYTSIICYPFSISTTPLNILCLWGPQPLGLWPSCSPWGIQYWAKSSAPPARQQSGYQVARWGASETMAELLHF